MLEIETEIAMRDVLSASNPDSGMEKPYRSRARRSIPTFHQHFFNENQEVFHSTLENHQIEL
jgi:hypothetical protein